MSFCKQHRFLSGLLLALILLSGPVCGKGETGAQDLPLPVRLVLSKISPMLQKTEYAQAAEILLAFQARGGPAPKVNQPDPKGYHHPEICFVLGNCYLMQEDYEPAAAAYRRAVARDPGHTFAWLNLGKADYEMERYMEAGDAFEKGYQSEAIKKPEHLYYSAVAYLTGGGYARAIKILEQLFAAHPAAIKPEWRENLVHALLAVNRPLQALPHIRELARIYTGEKQIQWQEILLDQYVRLEMHDKALKLALALTQDAPQVAKWWKGLAHIHLNAGHYKAALAALTVYSFLTPLSREEQKLLADLNMQLGIPVKAAPAYELCLQEKTDKQTLQALALAYRQLDRPEAALERVEASGLNADDIDLMLLRGELLYALKRFDKAAAAYREAARRKGRHTGRAWLMAGYAAWQMNELAASRDAFLKANRFRRQKKAAAAALQQLKEAFGQ